MLILTLGCKADGPVVLSTDFKAEFKTRTFGGGAGYLISNLGVIGKDGKIEFRDLKIEDAARSLLCDYQKINCNGSSSKVIILNPNKTLANYVFIDDTYPDKRAEPEVIAQAIMKKLEEADVLTVDERVRDIPRFVIEGINEKKLKLLEKPKDKNFRNQTRCNANQTNRQDNPSNANMKHMATLTQFIADLSFCLGVDIFLSDEVQSMKLANSNMMFDINTTDDEKELIAKLEGMGLKTKKYMVTSKYLEVNITPRMINLTKEGKQK